MCASTLVSCMRQLFLECGLRADKGVFAPQFIHLDVFLCVLMRSKFKHRNTHAQYIQASDYKHVNVRKEQLNSPANHCCRSTFNLHAYEQTHMTTEYCPESWCVLPGSMQVLTGKSRRPHHILARHVDRFSTVAKYC